MSERKSQKRVIDLLHDTLGYKYLGSQHDGANHNIRKDLLTVYLTKAGYDSSIINRGVNELVTVSRNSVKKLYEVNRDVYGILRYGLPLKLGAGEQTQTIRFINWQNPSENDFYVAEEVTVHGEHTKRPDVVLYINGIAVTVLELKRSGVSLSEGIRQNLDNQSALFVKDFFTTIQFCLAGNDTEGLRYGVVETSEKYYLEWKEDEKIQDDLSLRVRSLMDNNGYKLDNHLIALMHKERLLDILYNFMVFDGGDKKVCRPNQYFGVLAAKERVAKKEGGIIWHTQGSGKSLTMVWLSRAIKENNPNARILIVTDREELDEQIETDVFGACGVGDAICRTKSCADLIAKLNQYEPVTLCSLIHKFGVRGDDDSDKALDRDYEKYTAELLKNLPHDFAAKGEFYVFVDECHRTQSGKLHKAMKTLLPNAVFIGFTGTPLLARQKMPPKGERSSIEIFGSYIHTYKYDDATRDGIVLDLRYEARDIPQHVTSHQKIDEWFDLKTKGLADHAKARLKQHWGTLQNIFSSEARLGKVVCDIIFDMAKYPRLQSGRGNAILVAASIYEACKYYELFTKKGFTKCAIITSYSADISEVKGENTGAGDTENLFKYKVYKEMLGNQDIEVFEKEARKKFVNDPGQMKLLIVVDKLLTGFDAPSATYLYIDKSMRDHGLFQAICRVNRLDGEDKKYGYIIDYMDLFKALEQAVADYTKGAFEEFDPEDVEGLLKNRLTASKKDLEETLESLRTLCSNVDQPQGALDFIRFFCWKTENNLNELKANKPNRLALYQLTAALLRAYADIAPDLETVGYNADQIISLKKNVRDYQELSRTIKIASGDYIDLKGYEPDMRHLLDNYIGAEESKALVAFDELSLLELIDTKGPEFVHDLPSGIKSDPTAVAEVVESNVRRKIVERQLANPKYFEKMSVLLDELIRERKVERKADAEYLTKVKNLIKQVLHQEESAYPDDVKPSPAMRAFYDNVRQDADFVMRLHKLILNCKPDKWFDDHPKEKTLMREIRKIVDTDDEVDAIFAILKEQKEYR